MQKPQTSKTQSRKLKPLGTGSLDKIRTFALLPRNHGNYSASNILIESGDETKENTTTIESLEKERSQLKQKPQNAMYLKMSKQ